MLFKFGGPDPHLPRLIGAFLLFAALLMFLQAGAMMFDSWDSLKQYPNCISKIELEQTELTQMQKVECKEALYDATGVVLRGDQEKISTRQFWIALLGPIANLFFWAIVFIFGFMIYRTGTVVIPIEQSVRELPEAKFAAKKPNK